MNKTILFVLNLKTEPIKNLRVIFFSYQEIVWLIATDADFSKNGTSQFYRMPFTEMYSLMPDAKNVPKPDFTVRNKIVFPCLILGDIHRQFIKVKGTCKEKNI